MLSKFDIYGKKNNLEFKLNNKDIKKTFTEKEIFLMCKEADIITRGNVNFWAEPCQN